jgi:hypothetical protein
MWFRVRMTHCSCNVSDNEETEMKIAFTLNGSRSVGVDFEKRVQHRIGDVIASAFLTVGRRTALLLGPAALLLTFGCSVLIEPDRAQCSTDDDCTSRGPEFFGTVCNNSVCEDPWKCLDEPPAPTTPAHPYYVTVHAQSISNQRPVIDAEVTMCRKLDPGCTAPEAKTRTNENGDAVLQINQGVTNPFISIKKSIADNPDEDWVSAYYFFNPAINSDMNVTVQMATQTLRNQLIFVLQVPQQPDRGLILINAINCQGTAAQGITFSADTADDETTPFYVVGGIPNVTLSSTNTDGYGGFINIPAGKDANGEAVTVTATIEQTQRQMNTNSFVVRPNTITYSRMVPIGPPSTQ